MDAMIDLETMGTTVGAAIVSIGVVLFDPRKGRITDKNFYAELDWKNQERIIDQKCIEEFWKKQPKSIRQQLNGKKELPDVLEDLQFFLPNDVIVWGNGPTFDISKLEHAYGSYNLEIPWKYYNIRDCRTVRDLYDTKRNAITRGKVGSGNHNALGDAKAQCEYICKMWKSILS
jgi:hypothetical protein